MVKAMPYFMCGREFSARPPCTASKSALVICATEWLIDQYRIALTTGDYCALNKLFLRTDSISSRIVQAHTVSHTELH